MILFIWLALMFQPQPAPSDEFRDRLTKFHWAYDTFVREYIGCPPRPVKTPPKGDGLETVECNALAGKIDQAAFKRARDSAKALFDLEDRK